MRLEAVRAQEGPISGGTPELALWQEVGTCAFGCQSRVLTKWTSSISSVGEAAKECVKGAGGRSGFNLHRPAPQPLPLTALTDDNFIISDGKSSRLL